MSDFKNHESLAPSIETQSSNNNSSPSLENAKNTVYNSELTSNITTNDILLDASAAGNAVKNHPITQSVANGPVAENVKDQAFKTQNEFSNLAAARTTPANPAATGQQLTHYHSFFYSLLSWDNPRASGIAYSASVLFIFAARYLDVLRYAFKLTWMTLAITVLAEAVGKAVFSQGLTSQIRPRKYYTLPKQTLDTVLGDVHELINFFVIESQRIVFAENVFASGAAFVAAFISYYLIKVVPFWGLSLIATSVVFLTPLIYKSNKELIDEQLNHAASVANQQTEQFRKTASEQAARATSTTKQYVGDYSAKAQEYLGNARGRSTSPTTIKKENVPTSSFKQEDFPAAPKEDFKTAPPVGESVNALRGQDEPLIAT